MRTIQLSGHLVEMYDSIDELSIVRFHKYNKYVIVDSGVGADLTNVDNHIERAMRFIGVDKTDALNELENLRQCIYLIQEEISPRNLAFATLIYSIDGIPTNDLSDAGMKSLLEKLEDVNNRSIDVETESIKKKIDAELETYFPGLFDDTSIKEYFDELRYRTLLVCDEIIKNVNNEKEIDEITTLLITFSKPSIFSGKGSVEVKYDKQFENMCLLLSQSLNINPKNFTVLEYYNAFLYLKEQRIKEKQKRK